MKPPPSAMNDLYQKTAGLKTGERLPTALVSVKAARFASKGGNDPAAGAGIPFMIVWNCSNNWWIVKTAAPLEKKTQTEEDKFKELEAEVNRLVEESATAKLQGKLTSALDLAKEAFNKERQIRKLREQNGMVDQVNSELTFCVCVNMANQYQANKLYKEALNTYTIIVKNKNYPSSGRLRVNMGNIYYHQKNYPLAIKMYRMAMDTLPNVNKDMKVKILKNIGHAFVKLGQFQEAVDTYESIMESQPDHHTGFNLIVGYYALGDYEKMKKWFSKMLTIEMPGTEEMEEDAIVADTTKDAGPPKADPLKDYLKEQRDKAYKYITMAAKLMAPVIESTILAGYDWVLEALKAAEYPTIESEIEIAKAIHFIKRKDFEKAIELFKGFEKKDKVKMAIAANNISFLYFLERDYENAEKYAQIATQHDRYNAKALVNKGNCFFHKEEFDNAKEYYLEAIGVEANCIEAIFNLGLVNKRIGNYEEAIQAFEKLQTILPSNPEVIYQLGSIYELCGNTQQAIKWYNILVTRVPSDPAVLQKIGSLYYKEKDEIQALHFYQESYRYYPSNIETLSWLGVYYAKSDLYEKAIQFFERAAMIQPTEVKWKLMVATCYRKMNAYQQALKLYQEVNTQYPDNVDCLRYLVMLCKDLGLNYEVYAAQLRKLERNIEAKQEAAAAAAGYGPPEPGMSGVSPPRESMPAEEVMPEKRRGKMVQKQEDDAGVRDEEAVELLP